jgi:hypothetical protein
MLPLARIRRPCSLAVALLALSARALASPNYPETLDRQLGVECPRPLTRCLICHVTAAGGEGTAKKPFAQLLIDDYGLKGKAARTLAAALDALPADQDTDGDGTPDLDELTACGNPSGPDLSEGPGFGCSLRPEPLVSETQREDAGAGSSGQVGFSVLLALGLVRRRTTRAQMRPRRG